MNGKGNDNIYSFLADCAELSKISSEFYSPIFKAFADTYSIEEVEDITKNHLMINI